LRRALHLEVLIIGFFCVSRSGFFLRTAFVAKNTKEERRGEEKKRIEIIHNLCENSFVNFPNAQCPARANALRGPMPKK